MAERISNSFDGGMKSDLDKRLSKENTYELGVNGRILHNENGSLVWENSKGNKDVIDDYPSQYTAIGFCEFANFVIVFSKYNLGITEWDEIGYIVFNSETGHGVYNTLHKDTNDTENRDLNFNKEYPIKAKPFYESDEIIRVYWTDDYNEPRVFTFKKTQQNPVVLERITTTEFSMNLVPDFKMGEMEYNGIIKGSLRSGIYQYTYRLKTNDGYETPWVPPTFPIPITGIIPSQDGYAEQETYGMEDVDVIGKTGNIFIIRNMDRRYDSIEVAYIHSITEDSPKEAGIFYSSNIDKNSNNLDVYHVSVENIIPINNIDSLIDLKDVVKKAKTIEVHDNRLWLGNTETKTTFSIPDSVLENSYVEPEFRAIPIDLKSDRICQQQLAASKGGFKPINCQTQNFPAYKRKYEKFGSSDQYSVELVSQQQAGRPGGGLKDYSNYQGSLVNASWKGYFRGESYRFAVVFYDKKGYPFFAKHIADVKTPQHTVGKWNTGNTRLNSLDSARVKEDNTNVEKSVEVGNMGGIPTDINYNWVGHLPNNTRLSNTDCNKERNTSAGNIPNQYHISNNSPTKVSGNQFRSTRMIYHDPNNNSSDGTGEVNTDAWYNESNDDIAFTRILGFRFGGIDLNVEVDDKGTKLKDIVGAVQIVRAERTGADEQVKEQGIVLNCHTKVINSQYKTAYDERERPKVYTHSSPIFNGIDANSIYRNTTAQHIFRDDIGFENGYLAAFPNVHTYFGVNGIVAGDWYKNKTGITQLRYDFICDPSNVQSQASQDKEYMYLQDSNTGQQIVNEVNKHTPRSYVSKNLHTNNDNALFNDTTYYTYPMCNRVFDIVKITSNTAPFGKYGFFKDAIVDTNMWLARHEDVKNRNWESLSLYSTATMDGGGVGAQPDDTMFFRSVQAPSYILEIQGNAFSNAKGVLNNQHGKATSAVKDLSAYVASIVEINDQPYGGLRNEAIQNTRFHTTGHFLTISDDVLDDIEDGDYVLNELEVWGGDCVLDAFIFAKALPVIEYTGENTEDANECFPAAYGQDADNSETGEGRFVGGKEYREWSHGVIVPIESKYNYRLTYKDASNGVPTFAEVGFATALGLVGDESHKLYQPNTTKGLYASVGAECGDRYENFQLQSALSYFDTVRGFATKPQDFVEINDNPNRWHWSNLKQPHNQKIDKFRQFEELSNRDIDGNHGEITGSSILASNMYSFQDNAFGRMRINERAVTQSDIGDIQLGEGGTMDGVDYISTDFGTIHRDSVISSDKSIYWIDALKRAIIRFGGDGMSKISDMKELHTYLQPRLSNLVGKEDIINGNGITASFDYENNDVYFTIKDQSNAKTDEWKVIDDIPETHNGNLTLLYNEELQLFQSIITAYPTMYFRYANYLYSVNETGKGKIFKYNEGSKGYFFNKYFYSYLRFNVNYQSRFVKKFDTSIWNVNLDSLSNIETVSFTSEEVKHSYDDLSDETVNLNGFKINNVINRVKYREGLLRFPIRERSSGKPRLTGKSMKVEIWFKNSGNKLFSLSNIDTVVRYHSRK